jgi:DNA-3-methyladenine glycosylase I
VAERTTEPLAGRANGSVSPPAGPPPAPPVTGIVVGEDGLPRCGWGLSAPDYVAYHDQEWGRPVHGDDALFERVCLEAFQSGLSWLTILRRREGFRAAFAGFAIDAVAAFTDADRARLLADTGIIRNRAKIDAAIANAAAAATVRDTFDGGLDALVWSYAPDPATRPVPRTLADVPAVTPESTALAKDLKKRGFRFVGPTTAYALMQACGLVDDHLADCWARAAPAAR